MSYLHYLCLIARSPTHAILCVCIVFHRFVCPMFPVSLECPFLIAPLVFSNLYFVYKYLTCFHEKNNMHKFILLLNTM
jgi:hypothetical protein